MVPPLRPKDTVGREYRRSFAGVRKEGTKMPLAEMKVFEGSSPRMEEPPCRRGHG